MRIEDAYPLQSKRGDEGTTVSRQITHLEVGRWYALGDRRFLVRRDSFGNPVMDWAADEFFGVPVAVDKSIPRDQVGWIAPPVQWEEGLRPPNEYREITPIPGIGIGDTIRMDGEQWRVVDLAEGGYRVELIR